MVTDTRRISELTALIGVLYVARRFYRNWGATKAECRMRLPGDKLVNDPAVQVTEAVWIDAPPSAIWPWLSQIGQDRGESRHNLVGDPVRATTKGWAGCPGWVTFTVADIVPAERIVLRAGPANQPRDAVWSFHLMPHGDDRSRLLVRLRSGLRHPGAVIGMELVRPLAALWARAMLRGIKRRAERSQSASVAPRSGAKASANEPAS